MAKKRKIEMPAFEIEGIPFVPSQIGHRVIRHTKLYEPATSLREDVLDYLKLMGKKAILERGVLIGYMLDPPLPRVRFADGKGTLVDPSKLIWDVW